MGSILGDIALVFGLLIGIAIIPFGLPGKFVIAGEALLYGWLTHFDHFNLTFVGILLFIAVVAELVETVLSAIFAKKFGGSKQGMVGAIIGSMIGAIIGTPVTPVLGTIVGAFLGAFLGATLLEWIRHHEMKDAIHVGFGAMIGSMSTVFFKFFVAVFMMILILVKIF